LRAPHLGPLGHAGPTPRTLVFAVVCTGYAKPSGRSGKGEEGSRHCPAKSGSYHALQSIASAATHGRVTAFARGALWHPFNSRCYPHHRVMRFKPRRRSITREARGLTRVRQKAPRLAPGRDTLSHRCSLCPWARCVLRAAGQGLERGAPAGCMPAG